MSDWKFWWGGIYKVSLNTRAEEKLLEEHLWKWMAWQLSSEVLRNPVPAENFVFIVSVYKLTQYLLIVCLYKLVKDSDYNIHVKFSSNLKVSCSFFLFVGAHF